MAGMYTYKTFKRRDSDINTSLTSVILIIRQCFWVKLEVHIGVGMVILRKRTFMYSGPKKYLHLKG